jgi:hypothetical protein
VTSHDIDHCGGCVYYPPNLPAHAYSAADYAVLQALPCAFECTPHDADCRQLRKTSCSLLDLNHLPQPHHTEETR